MSPTLTLTRTLTRSARRRGLRAAYSLQPQDSNPGQAA
jgi:hypothetical protein